MSKLTLCLPYYRNAGMLTRTLTELAALPAQIRAALEVIVVDDGSPDGEARGAEIGCPLWIYRVGVDIRWNQDAARNIAAHHAESPWLLLTDIDHLVPRGTFAAILETKLRKETVYRFSRETLEPNGETTPYKPHPNSWLIRKALYWTIGGYDERFAGFYGTDSDFRNRVSESASEIKLLPQVLVRVPRTVIPDASTTTYERKAPQDGPGINRIKAARNALPQWRPLVLQCPYRLIYPPQPRRYHPPQSRG
jgi:glycosyltransferase involved in cell wall biosynthesis